MWTYGLKRRCPDSFPNWSFEQIALGGKLEKAMKQGTVRDVQNAAGLNLWIARTGRIGQSVPAQDCVGLIPKAACVTRGGNVEKGSVND